MGVPFEMAQELIPAEEVVVLLLLLYKYGIIFIPV